MEEIYQETDHGKTPIESPASDVLDYTPDEIETMRAIRLRQQQYEEGTFLSELGEEDEKTDPEEVDISAYAGLSDEEVVELCHSGDTLAEEYLLNRYKNFVRSKARSYFLIGADHEDIVQEGMIGLYKAIRDYKPDKLSQFHAFAELCITRQIITAIKTATRQKHIPLNSYVSLNRPLFDDESDRTLMDVIIERHADNPEELIISQENLKNIHHQISSVLSPLEQEVLSEYLDGKSYQEIAERLGRHAKSIDNALQRVKRKLMHYLQESEAEDTPGSRKGN